jgi:predicted permease
MELYLKLFEVLFPVFFVVGIGYYLGKNNPKLDTTFITNFAAAKLVINVVSSLGLFLPK